MQIIYAHEELPTMMTKSIFLAGPTPRKGGTTSSWRPTAIKKLEQLGFDGHVFVPEPRDGVWAENWLGQVEWEEEALNQADCILFWLPRNLEDMPAFTTNDEWGAWKASGKVVFGSPPGAEKVRYQRHYAQKLKVPAYSTLHSTVYAALQMVGKGSIRGGGEVKVPLYVWNQESFQQWYKAQRAVGNRLLDAKVLWQFTAPKAGTMFMWVLKVSVFVATENRVKDIEFVVGRPDISAVVLWHRAHTLKDTEVVLIKEFRSPGRTFHGFVRELPGGSAKPGTDPRMVAVEELKEETGFEIRPSRLKELAPRQLYATLSSVVSNAFCAEITAYELATLKDLAGQPRGKEEDTERTYVEVWRMENLLAHPHTDWSTLGMIFVALSEAMS